MNRNNAALDEGLQSRTVGSEEGVALGDTIDRMRSDWIREALDSQIVRDAATDVASGVADQQPDDEPQG